MKFEIESHPVTCRRYEVVEADTLTFLQEIVNHRLERGWELVGNLVVTGRPPRFLREMIKETREEVNE